MSARVLVVDDDRLVREALGQTLELSGLVAVLAGSYIEAKDHLTPGFEGVVISDIRMPGKDGFALLDFAAGVDPELPVILLTGEGDIPMAVRGMTAGAFAFLEKPCAPQDLLATVDKALRTRALVLENRRLKRQLAAGDAAARILLGHSPAAEALRQQVRAIAGAATEVLVCGEPGTGTAKVAEVIHLTSAAAAGPFTKLAAASLAPEGLADAMGQSRGGTLFLDEVAALPPATQFAALERLEGRPGVRVIGGTYRDLAALAEAGQFNPDLYYRLDVMRVRIPSLRERKQDIPDLFRHYVAQACERAALPLPEIPSELTARLMAQDWPGNARALMNAAARFAAGLSEAGDVEQEAGLAEQLAQVERAILIDALQRQQGRATEAARQLKLPRKTFYDKLARHGIRPDAYR